MRSRQHVVIARLSDKEYEDYERILRKASREYGYPRNKSEAFRIVLRLVNNKLKQEASDYFYTHCLDV
jgi:hypothetical protein